MEAIERDRRCSYQRYWIPDCDDDDDDDTTKAPSKAMALIASWIRICICITKNKWTDLWHIKKGLPFGNKAHNDAFFGLDNTYLAKGHFNDSL